MLMVKLILYDKEEVEFAARSKRIRLAFVTVTFCAGRTKIDTTKQTTKTIKP
jgi:hypothetical protein